MPVQNKFLDTLQSEGYDAISGAKATGNLNEAEDEAEASIADISSLSDAYTWTKVVLWQRNRVISLLEYIILDTSVIEYKINIM